jgi:hypothetical protein
VDDLLLVMIMAGIGLSGAYFRAELLVHQRMTAVRRKRELLQLELHTQRVRLEHQEMSRQPRAAPASIPANIVQVMRDLLRALRSFIHGCHIHRLWIRT